MTLSTHKQAVNGTSFATASITFTGACVVDETIVIVDGAGLSKTYTAKGSTTAGSLQFINTDKDAAATALKLCIENAAGHNGSITVTNTPAGTITITLTTAGQVGTGAGDIPALITEGLTNATATAFSGGNSGAEAIDRHTVAGGGTVGGFNSTANIKNNIDLAVGGKAIGSKVVAKTGTIGKAGVALARSGGTLAYNPQSKSVTLSSANTGWLIRSGSSTLLSGIASTDNILASPGSDTTSRRQSLKRSYRQKGLWSDQVFDLHTGLLKQADGTDKAGIANRGDIVDDGVNRDLEGDALTRAIPGEFVILFNFASFTTNMVDYSALNG
jgi:hypothetical protein